MLVLGIFCLLLALVVPALVGFKSAGDINRATAEVGGILENARSFARANNTYVWVGFFEENAVGGTAPASSGTGRIIISVVASKDGTRLSATQLALDPAGLVQINKLIRIENMHLAAPGGSFPLGSGTGVAFEGRPAATAQIGADLPASPLPPFNSPGSAGSYTFTRVLEFTPRGEARADSSGAIPPLIEVGLQATHGNYVDTASMNVAAIQISGIAGNVKTYRR